MATARSRLEILLDVIGGRAAKSEVESVSNGIQTLSLAYMGVRNALSDVQIAAQKAYDFINEGAQLELTAIKFDRLAESIGTTGDALRNDLRTATQGMVSDAGQMALAGDLMSLGLAKTHEEAIRLSGVASQLGMDMNQLVLTLTNQTTMRFDALGIAVDGFDEKVKALEDQGYATDEAFKWAFIEQAEDQIERVGSVADTTAGKLLQLESNLSNLTDGTKKFSAMLAGPVIGAMADNVMMSNALFDAVKNGNLTYLEAYRINQEVMLTNKTAGEVLEDLATAEEQANAALAEHIELMRQASDISRPLGELMEEQVYWTGTAAATYADAAREAQMLAIAERNRADAIVIANQPLSDSIQLQNEFAAAAGATVGPVGLSATGIANWASALDQATSSIGTLTGTAPNLSGMIEGLLQEIEIMAGGGGEIKSLLDAIIPADVPYETKQRWLTMLQGLVEDLGTLTVSTDDLDILGDFAADDVDPMIQTIKNELAAETYEIKSDVFWAEGGTWLEFLQLTEAGVIIPVYLDVRGNLQNSLGSGGVWNPVDTGNGIIMD